jgi:hypothetical protein
MLDIVRSGIVEVVFYQDEDHHDSGSMCVNPKMDETAKIAKHGNVKLRAYNGQLSWLQDRINALKNLKVL